MAPIRVGIVQQKGGVGKTTLTINIGGALNEIDNDVLLVDMDPQGYLTSGVGLDEAYTADAPTLYDALISPNDHDVADLAEKHPEFDVLPANVDMFTLSQDLTGSMRSRERLGMLLEDSTEYDTVLVDAPPSLGILTDNVLLGTRGAVIPAQAEDTSIRAIDLLFKQIDSLEQNFGTTIRELGIVASAVEYPLDNEQSGMLDWFKDTFDGRMPVFEVRKRAAIKRAYNAGVSIFRHEEECDQEPAFEEIARSLQEADDV